MTDAPSAEAAAMTTSDAAIGWRAIGWLGASVAVGVLAVLAAAAAGRFDLLAFGSPLLGALAGAWWSARPGDPIRVRATVSARRVFEGELVSVVVELTAPPGVEVLGAEVHAGAEVAVTAMCVLRPTAGSLRAEWELRAVHWGRSTVDVQVSVQGAAGLLVGEAYATAAEVAVFPNADRTSVLPRPMDLPDLLGVHLGRRRGEGVEFAGIREYQPGDPLRSVNWRATARGGRLRVTERLVEQAAKVVSVIDAAQDVRQPGSSTLELSVRGALAVVWAGLRRGDRCGVAGLGGVVRWLSPDLGRRHYYRVLEALLDVRPATSRLELGIIDPPRTALPRGAVVVVFSPLLDERVVGAVADLRRRGFALAVVDVLRVEPTARPGSDYDPLAVRMWRLGRRGLRRRLAELGVPVLTWADGMELDEVLRPVSARPPLLGDGRPAEPAGWEGLGDGRPAEPAGWEGHGPR